MAISKHDLAKVLELATIATANPDDQDYFESEVRVDAENALFEMYEAEIGGELEELEADYSLWLLHADTEEMVASVVSRLCWAMISHTPYSQRV